MYRFIPAARFAYAALTTATFALGCSGTGSNEEFEPFRSVAWDSTLEEVNVGEMRVAGITVDGDDGASASIRVTTDSTGPVDLIRADPGVSLASPMFTPAMLTYGFTQPAGLHLIQFRCMSAGTTTIRAELVFGDPQLSPLIVENDTDLEVTCMGSDPGAGGTGGSGAAGGSGGMGGAGGGGDTAIEILAGTWQDSGLGGEFERFEVGAFDSADGAPYFLSSVVGKPDEGFVLFRKGPTDAAPWAVTSNAVDNASQLIMSDGTALLYGGVFGTVVLVDSGGTSASLQVGGLDLSALTVCPGDNDGSTFGSPPTPNLFYQRRVYFRASGSCRGDATFISGGTTLQLGTLDSMLPEGTEIGGVYSGSDNPAGSTLAETLGIYASGAFVFAGFECDSGDAWCPGTNGSAFLHYDMSTFTPIAVEGQMMSTAQGDLPFGESPRRQFSSYDDTFVFDGLLGGAEALIKYDGSGLTVLMLEDDPAPGVPGATYRQLTGTGQAVFADSEGLVTFMAELNSATVPRYCIFREPLDGGPVERVVCEGDPVPDGGTGTFSGSPLQMVVSPGGFLAFSWPNDAFEPQIVAEGVFGVFRVVAARGWGVPDAFGRTHFLGGEFGGTLSIGIIGQTFGTGTAGDGRALAFTNDGDLFVHSQQTNSPREAAVLRIETKF
ncbi:MAG: hypothetical protein AAF500_18925 [Myxococcota bacterium]